jgi:AcrR family transcriptional regulator
MVTKAIKRVRRSPEASKRAILEAAERRLIEDGPDGVRVQRIAADLGMTDAALHFHFGNREALVEALMRFSAKRLVEDIGDALETWDADRLDLRFPATTSCSLSWLLTGSAVRPGVEQPVLERTVFRGPHTRPVVARHRGPLHMFILLLAPDALCRMTGIRVDRLSELLMSTHGGAGRVVASHGAQCPSRPAR